MTVVTYTVPEAAKALGRSDLTFRKWIQEDLIPEPILRDVIRGYRLYSQGELQSIARVLAEHEQEFAYYAVRHEATRHRMFQHVQAYRAHSV